MNLFSLMQSICEQDEEDGRGSEREQVRNDGKGEQIEGSVC